MRKPARRQAGAASVFCSHDVREFERLSDRSAALPAQALVAARRLTAHARRIHRASTHARRIMPPPPRRRACTAPPRRVRDPPFDKAMAMSERLQEGQMVFVTDGELGVGAVREVRQASDGFVVNIQNGGDFVLPLSAVKDVHSGKVILAVDRLPEQVRQALRHPHDAELPSSTYAATDPGDGALKD